MTPSSGTNQDGVYITWYGYNDNSCSTEDEHGCTSIAYPKSDGYPVPHEYATEGTGAYDSPVTFATSPDEYAPGTRIYVPLVRKYFVMEDSCHGCIEDWSEARSYHVDLWMGPDHASDDDALRECQEKLTVGHKLAGTARIVVDPPSNLPVDTTPLFKDDTCTAHMY